MVRNVVIWTVTRNERLAFASREDEERLKDDRVGISRTQDEEGNERMKGSAAEGDPREERRTVSGHSIV